VGMGGPSTVTVVFAVADVQPATTRYREYVPDMAALALGRVGSSRFELHPPGPLQT
jgi:hypothetical protein